VNYAVRRMPSRCCRPVPQAPQRHLPGGGLSPHVAVGGGDPLCEAPRVRDSDAVHRHLGLQVRPLLLSSGGVARLRQGLTQIGDELRDPRIRLPALRHLRSSSPHDVLSQTFFNMMDPGGAGTRGLEFRGPGP